MKVAGSLWLPKTIVIVKVLVPIFFLFSITVGEEKVCLPMDQQNNHWTYDENIIDEIALVSQKLPNPVPNFLEDLLKPYDATPFWYNLIQAISLATGVTPTTEALMHELATSSFYSANFNSSLKQTLSYIQCHESIESENSDGKNSKSNIVSRLDTRDNKDLEQMIIVDNASEINSMGNGNGNQDNKISSTKKAIIAGLRDFADVDDTNIWLEDGINVESTSETDSVTTNSVSPMHGKTKGKGQATDIEDEGLPGPKVREHAAVEWSPWRNLISIFWNPEEEISGNALTDAVRKKRELRSSGGFSNKAAEDLHQPFFMSEVLPSPVVNRNPSIISVSGCPSGHIQDLRGHCRQIFQYTVNYGVGAPSPSGTGFGSARGSGLGSGFGSGFPGSRRPPWLFNRPTQRPRPGSLRDIVRESNLYKHSVMRGYVPPFMYSDLFAKRKSNEGGRRNKDRSIPSIINLRAGAASPKAPQPQPVQIMSPMPKIIVMSSVGGDSGSKSGGDIGIGSISVPTTVILPMNSVNRNSVTEEGTKGLRSNNKIDKDNDEGYSKSGGSSETFEQYREKSDKGDKSKGKYITTTTANRDDDD